MQGESFDTRCNGINHSTFSKNIRTYKHAHVSYQPLKYVNYEENLDYLRTLYICLHSLNKII